MVRITRQRISLLILLVAFLVTIQASLPQEARGQSNVYVASLDQNIDPGAQDFVVASINEATSSGIHNFILIINTNGGAGVNMENIISAISVYKGAGNRFTTLIAPGSAHAFSAGAYIAESSTNITMVPGTVIGSATPIVSGIPTGQENTTFTKDINAFTQYMVSITPGYRNATATALMVTGGRSYSCQTYASCYAKQQHVVDVVLNVSNTQDALNALGAGGAVIHTPGITSTFLSIISDPNLDSILFLAGTFAILADLYHPTLIFTVVGGVAIALALLGLGVFGAPFVSIVLMLIGAVFIFLELKTHHGVSAIAGVIIFIVGFLLIFSLPSSAPAPPAAPSGSGTFIAAGVLTYVILGLLGGGGVLGSVYLYRVRETLMNQPPAQNPKAIIGKKGRLTSDLKAGEVATANIGSEDFTVTGSTDLPKGTLVIVKDLEGLRLIVEKTEN
jgi:membrane-bound serine protease (ClpP class)